MSKLKDDLLLIRKACNECPHLRSIFNWVSKVFLEKDINTVFIYIQDFLFNDYFTKNEQELLDNLFWFIEYKSAINNTVITETFKKYCHANNYSIDEINKLKNLFINRQL